MTAINVDVRHPLNMGEDMNVEEELAKKLFQAATDEPWGAASPTQEAAYREQARQRLENDK